MPDDETPATQSTLARTGGHVHTRPTPSATLAELAAATMAAVGSDNTRRAFRGDWKMWLAFWAMAERDGHEPEPLRADPAHLVAFARWLATPGPMPDGEHRDRAAPESIRRRLTGVMAGWSDRGVDYPRGISKEARRFVKSHETRLIEHGEPTGRGQAQPLRVEDLRKIADATDTTTLAGARDMALVLLDFSIGGRRSELAHLDVEDIVGTPDGIEIHVRKSKTGHREPAITYQQNPATCPVRAWERWSERSALTTGPAFVTVDRHGNLGARMSGEAVGEVIARAGKRAALPYRITGHSARRGFATEARRAGHSVEKIADQAGWQRNSAVLHRYIDSVDKWTDNPLNGMGL